MRPPSTLPFCSISKASRSQYLRSGDESGHGTLLFEPHPGETIQTVMDSFKEKFKSELNSRPNQVHPFLKFTLEQRYWFQTNMKKVKPVLHPGDLLLWLSGVPHCSHATGEHRVARLGLFITANLRHNADATALKQRLEKVEMGKIGGHNCWIASGMSGSASQRVAQSYADDPIIRSVAGGEVAAAEFADAFNAFTASVRKTPCGTGAPSDRRRGRQGLQKAGG